MPKIKAEVKPVGFRKMLTSFSKKLKDLEEFEKARGEYWKQAQQQIGEMYVGAVRERINDRSGLLTESISYKSSKNGNGVEIYSDESFFHGRNSDGKKLTYYAPFVEEGVGLIRPKKWRYKKWRQNGAKKKDAPKLIFYSPWVNKEGIYQEWWKLPVVKGQEAQHFMRNTSKSKRLQKNALEIMLNFAVQCIANTKLKEWRNASGNRRGINFTAEWKRVYGGKSKRR